ncbi:MAG: hypothetical protein RI900_860, partial [Actinomycetota bacterium]
MTDSQQADLSVDFTTEAGLR